MLPASSIWRKGKSLLEGGYQACGLSEEMAAQQVGEDDERQSRHCGEGAQRKLALAEQRSPIVEQQVVTGRVDVTFGPIQDQIECALGDAGRVALVVPERLRVEAVEAQSGGQEEDGDENGEGSAPFH